ncbi:DNA-directed RNA polymerase II [Variovorax sp. H27-G14]
MFLPSVGEAAEPAVALKPSAMSLVESALEELPRATPFCALTFALRPMAMPPAAAAVTLDWPPMAMESLAAACAPLTALLPIATAPAPEAVVEFATLRGVVPSPPAPPIATEFSAEALAPKPMAMLDMPPADDSRPKDEPQR